MCFRANGPMNLLVSFPYGHPCMRRFSILFYFHMVKPDGLQVIIPKLQATDLVLLARQANQLHSCATVAKSCSPSQYFGVFRESHKSGAATRSPGTKKSTISFLETPSCQKRIASYRSIKNANPSQQVGKLLPVSFHGSPLKQRKDTEDALSVVQRLGRPHLMITTTCNPDWPEIRQNLLPHQSVIDRPDLCDRVFKLKIKQLMGDLYSGKIFGKPVYHLSVIETQKRGLPHQHLIVKFDGDSPDKRGEIDEWVWARLPPHTICDGRLRALVLKYMIHRKCGSHQSRRTMHANRQENK